jgi:DNA adenine methylase
MANAIQPFPWYGGKALKLNFIIPNLPLTDYYIEPFGGSGTILLNREPVDFEVFNDLDERVMTFFRVLQTNSEELIDCLELTPYHEGLFEEAWEILQSDEASDFDKAWAFFVRAACSYNSSPDKGFAYATKEVRRNRSQTVSRFQTKIDKLDEVVERLRRVQFMNRDALEIIERFDREDALFYLDPPYPHGVRNGAGYKHEMDDDEHRELLETALNVEGYVCLSSFSNPLYDDLLDDWWVADGREYKTPASNDQRTCTERLYMNYDPEEQREYQTRIS